MFACKQHTLYVSKYLLKWSKISLLLYRLLVSLWVGVVWANFLQQNLTNKQTIIIVLLVYLDQEVQKSVIERRSAMSGYLGSKITESQQSFVKETWLFAFANDKRKIWASVLFLSAIMLRNRTHVNFFHWDTEILLPWQHEETTSPLYHYAGSSLIFNHFFFIIRCMFNIQETVELREPIQALQIGLPHWTTSAG